MHTQQKAAVLKISKVKGKNGPMLLLNMRYKCNKKYKSIKWKYLSNEQVPQNPT